MSRDADIVAYLLGESSPEEGAAVERRMGEDAGFRREVERMRPIVAGLEALPPEIQERLRALPRESEVIEVVMDLGRRPEARFGGGGEEVLLDREIVAQIADQADARDVEIGKGRLVALAPLGHDPADLDPMGQLDLVDPTDQPHHLGQRPHADLLSSARGS